MSEGASQEYTNKMIEAFVDKPEKTFWYQNAFSKYNMNGIDVMKWHWSWWAFFGGFLFLLYRKQYVPSIVLLLLGIFSAIIPLGSLIVAILAGGYSTYFIYKGYKTKLNEIQASISDEDKQVETMRVIGGYHQWVVWVYAIGVIIGLIALITYASVIGSMLS